MNGKKNLVMTGKQRKKKMKGGGRRMYGHGGKAAMEKAKPC